MKGYLITVICDSDEDCDFKHKDYSFIKHLCYLNAEKAKIEYELISDELKFIDRLIYVYTDLSEEDKMLPFSEVLQKIIEREEDTYYLNKLEIDLNNILTNDSIPFISFDVKFEEIEVED